jgi:hypothetical protein
MSPNTLARIFHIDRDEKTAKPDLARIFHTLDSHCDLDTTSARLALSGLPKGSLPRGLPTAGGTP